MESTAHRAIAIVGAGAILPDAPSKAVFWQNIQEGRYSISEVPPERWNPEFYFDPDPAAPDKTYSKIGGWVRHYEWSPMQWHLPIPPRVSAAMDDAQKWAIACTWEALNDFGYPQRVLDPERTAVILGNAMAGEKHYLTSLRVYYPEFADELSMSESFASLPEPLRTQILREVHAGMGHRLPEINEDTMPGELANCLAGRIANVFNFRGPNFVADAACASAMAAISAAAEGLVQHDFDAVVTGGIDRNMGAPTFTKFCKIGALSATGTRPYAEGADGFVMGEGAVILLLKRLADAERDGDKIYAVLRGVGASSDGKGKGITAPNPIGQRLCTARAWKKAGLDPATATLIEGHGTSTRVGDVVEVESLTAVLNGCSAPAASIALGSVKSNIGHLKGAAGAAGLLKTALSLHHKVLPPSVNCTTLNPEIDFQHSPLYVNTKLRLWEIAAGEVRRAGVSAFGFGGTNFHLVLEEYIPGRLNGKSKIVAVEESVSVLSAASNVESVAEPAANAPLRGALLIGAASTAELIAKVRQVQTAAQHGEAPSPQLPSATDLRAARRIAIDYGSPAELACKCDKAIRALEAANQPALWKALRADGIFAGSGAAAKAAFLYTGQGSQYLNMLRQLRAASPIVSAAFDEADAVLAPLLGNPLTSFIFQDLADEHALADAEEALRQTAVTQPAVIAADVAITRLLASYGLHPDMVMGHSVGEYGALVASGALPFADALRAVSARGSEMTRVSLADNGRMAAVFAPLPEVERLLKTVDGYVVIANINSISQSVIGGASASVERAVEVFLNAGYNAVPLPVSHGFHTSIVAPASAPLKLMLKGLALQPPELPTVCNVDGNFYPAGPGATAQMIELLSRQVAAPVQFVTGLNTLYRAGARLFVETGPKKALQGFAEDVLDGGEGVVTLFTNHPKLEDAVAFNRALCGCYAAGLGATRESQSAGVTEIRSARNPRAENSPSSFDAHPAPLSSGHAYSPVVITGAALGLPGTEHIFDDGNLARILNGDQFIDSIPMRLRHAILSKHITRLVKSDDGAAFETIEKLEDVIKLAGRGNAFDLEQEFGIASERIAAFDRVTSLAIAAGIDALRDAGIPLVLSYKTTSRGTQLPDRWLLPEHFRDETGVIFASAFPGYNAFADELTRYYLDLARREQLATLEALQERNLQSGDGAVLGPEIAHHIDRLRTEIQKQPYIFDRRFLFRALPMGHSQFAELIGARGPNTQLNSACASTAQAITLAEDWIRAGRCRRVVVVSADDVTSDRLLEWIGAGFLASGAAATDDVIENAALPFDRRRHGMLVGMGAAALVLESNDAARERALRPICEVMSSATANSAYHGTRLDVRHIGQLMEQTIAAAESRFGISRHELASQMVFVSHETYTPARGGSASAEVAALRSVFGEDVQKIVVANTKGLTGHTMGAGIEDVVAVKALETGCVPPVPNFKEVDPELGELNLSKGGIYPIQYALRLAAGFGSQISLVLLRYVGAGNGADNGPRPAISQLGYPYRIADQAAWQAHLARMNGGSNSELEVVNHTLRVRAARQSASVVPLKPELISATLPAQPQPIPEAPQPTARTADAPPIPQASVPVAVTGATAYNSEEVRERVLQLVVEKTGYPKEMLDLDLDLEADLGIDTVKQAEMFAAIRQQYGIARDDRIRLRDFPTLAHVIDFVLQRQPATAIPDEKPPVHAEAAAVSQPVHSAAPTSEELSVEEKILALVVEKTGYPKEMLDLDLDLEADLGIDTVKQAEMFAAIRQTYQIPRDGNLKLRDYPTLSHVIAFVNQSRQRPASVASVSAAPKPASQAGISKPEPTSTVAPQVAAPAQAVPQSSPANVDAIREKVLEIVAQKTGYPKEMLDLDLDLEADLGIDTVKQAEMFSEVRAAYSIPRDVNLKLRDFPTLAHVIEFARQRQQGAVTVSPAPPVRPQPASFEACDRIPRRVPLPVLRPPLKFCKPTGVTLGANSRVIVMADRGLVAAALSQRLRELGVEVLSIDNAPSTEELTALLTGFINSGPVQGIYWLPALDDEGDLQSLDITRWHEALRVRVKLFYQAMRTLYDKIAEAGAFLVTATVLGGQHGYDPAGATAPLGGAVTGFAKAYKRERAEVLAKAVDFEPQHDPSRIAELLVSETLSDPGAVEVGYKHGLRWSVALDEQPLADGLPGIELGSDTVFLVTGAAGGIVSAITADLAAASGGTFYLLDLIPEPDPNNPDLRQLATDRDGLKRELFARIQSRGQRATPALVERELATLERAQAALSTINSVRAAGGTAHYFGVDLTNAEAVARVIEELRKRSGRIDVLLHAAGMERSHFLPDKAPQEFNLVFDVKTDGWFNLMHAIGKMPLRAAVVFSSVAGRFGNAGQADYSSANDLLCKLTSSLRRSHPETRAIAIDWTAWAGLGMATRGSIPKMMELAGIDMLSPEAGVPLIRRELTASGRRGEIVIGQKLGVLFNEWEQDGGMGCIPAPSNGIAAAMRRPMMGKIVGMPLHEGLIVETELDPSAQPFLHDHQIDGTPVLPGVMGIEAFAEAACLLLPNWHIRSIEQISFLAPFKFYRNQPRKLTLKARIFAEGEGAVADCRLIGSRTLPTHPAPELTTHFTARVHLQPQPEPLVANVLFSAQNGSAVETDAIYRVYFHGPAYRVLERAWRNGDSIVGQMRRNLPSECFPPDLPMLALPRLIELCFQTTGLWEIAVTGHLGLPRGVESVRFSGSLPAPDEQLFAIVRSAADGAFHAEAVDRNGKCYLSVRGYRTAQLPHSVDSQPFSILHEARAASLIA